MNKRLLVLLGLAGLLAGCVTMTPEELRAADEQTCRNYGFKLQTEAFANCLLRLDLDRRADSRASESRSGFYGRPIVLY